MTTHDDPPEKQKYCRRCQTWQPVTNFYFRSSTSSHRAAYCKKCHTKPFRDEKIRCPHCKKCIVFLGIDEKKNVVRSNSSFGRRIKRDLGKKNQLTEKRKRKVKQDENDIRKLFDE